MRENLILDDFTPDQVQVIQKVITLIDYPSFFAYHRDQLRKLKGDYYLKATTIEAVGCVEMYFIELSIGGSIFGGFVFAVVQREKCGQRTSDPLLDQWVPLETTHCAYAIQPLCFLTEDLVFNATVAQELLWTFRYQLQQQGDLPAVVRLNQMLERELSAGRQ